MENVLRNKTFNGKIIYISKFIIIFATVKNGYENSIAPKDKRVL